MQTACMPNVTIRDVPDAEVLTQREWEERVRERRATAEEGEWPSSDEVVAAIREGRGEIPG